MQHFLQHEQSAKRVPSLRVLNALQNLHSLLIGSRLASEDEEWETVLITANGAKEGDCLINPLVQLF